MVPTHATFSADGSSRNWTYSSKKVSIFASSAPTLTMATVEDNKCVRAKYMTPFKSTLTEACGCCFDVDALLPPPPVGCASRSTNNRPTTPTSPDKSTASPEPLHSNKIVELAVFCNAPWLISRGIFDFGTDAPTNAAGIFLLFVALLSAFSLFFSFASSASILSSSSSSSSIINTSFCFFSESLTANGFASSSSPSDPHPELLLLLFFSSSSSESSSLMLIVLLLLLFFGVVLSVFFFSSFESSFVGG
mmetsp:Transcript_4692/g.15177  ORF Transcript_4692/g.15177 Transcript_4692/m.15177 type:complete len:249 (+) Transcript_4692:179-925(+)